MPDRIARITPDGNLTEFAIPYVQPGFITAGPDGNFWFGEFEFQAQHIGRLTLDGQYSEFQLPTPDREPAGITAAALTGEARGRWGDDERAVDQSVPAAGSLAWRGF